MRPWALFLSSILFQFAGFILSALYQEAYPNPSQAVLIALPTLIATVFCLVLRFPITWTFFNALVPLGLTLVQLEAIPSWFFLLGFIVLLGLHLPAVWTHVPYYPTPTPVYEEIIKEIPDTATSIIDVGCGMGGLLTYLSKKRPELKIYGVEIGIIAWLASLLRSIGRNNIKVSFKSFWKLNFADYDVIYAFLSPAPMKELWEKFLAEARPGAILISNSFEAPAPATKIVKAGEKNGMMLYIYVAV